MNATQTKPTSAEAHCLALANGAEQYTYYLVRIPMRGNARVGASLAKRLGDRCERIITGKCWRIFVPLARQSPGWRNYILRDDWDCGTRYLAALLQALQEFGLLEVAQVFTADASAGVMRRVVSDVVDAR